MSFLLSPSFLVLNLLSLVVLIVELSGLARAVRRHNRSPIGLLCGRNAWLPTHATRLAVATYVALTVAYFFLPGVLHNLIS